MLIGLNGQKLSGKDTVGTILVENYDFNRVAFADKLKQAAAALMNCSIHEVDKWKDYDPAYVIVYTTSTGDLSGKTYKERKASFTWREFLQRFGTEMGRDVFGEDFWVDHCLLNPMKDRIPEGWADKVDIVVTDARFNNELKRIKDLGGYNFRINRPGLNGGDRHSSEALPDMTLIDGFIQNDGTIEHLRGEVANLVGSLVSNKT